MLNGEYICKIFSYVDCVKFWFATSEHASQYPRTSMALLNLLIVVFPGS